MHKTRLTVRILGITALLTSALLTLRAQNDADSQMVSEEATMDAAVNADVGAVASTEPALEPESNALEAELGADLVAAEAATESPESEPAPEGDDSAADLGTLEATEPVAAEPLAALEEAPAEDVPAEEEATELATIDEGAAELVVEEALIAEEPAAEQEPGVSEPPVEAAAVAPVEGAPRAPQASSDHDKYVMVLREGEELRRRAFVEHATEKVALADAAFLAKDYVTAEQEYERAISALEQAGGRAENREALKRARAGVLESKYRRAVLMRAEGDLDDARKIASDANMRGHAKAAALVARIDKDIEARKAKPPQPEAEKARWKQEEFRRKSADVSSKLHRGREFFMANELEMAQDEFEAVLAVDPDNTEAIRWREKVTQTRLERASMELETTRVDMTRMVRERWNPRDYGAGYQPVATKVAPTTISEGKSQEALITKKMQDIIIPEIDFRQANINDVVTFLQTQSVEGDPEHKGVNFILNLSGVSGGGGSAAGAGTFEGDFAFNQDGGAEDAMAASGELITFRAREITLLDALKIVTDVANLKYRIEGNVVMVLHINAAEQKIVHRMYPVLPSVGERISAIRESTTGGAGYGGDFGTLDSAPIEASTDWKAFFSDLGVKWPIGSSIKHVPAIGQLMVANTPDNLAVFEERLAALNIVPKQIEIEARFVEVNQTDLTSLGLEWLLTDNFELFQKKSDANLPLAAQQRVVVPKTDFTSGNRFATDNATIQGAPEGLANAADGILAVASVLTNPELAVILHAMEQKGHADLLSAPKVTTQSGIEAQIKVVTEYIYPSEYEIEPAVPPLFGGSGTTAAGSPPVVTPAAFETREVGVILTVLPEVSTEGEMIQLTMSPEVVTEPTWHDYGQTFTDVQGNSNRIPIEQPFFHSRSISTSILIYNGSTVVMGGMITEDRQQVDDRVPFLGDIPLLGRLFRSTYDHSIKKNLLIFVTARLVDPAGRPVGSAARRPDTSFLPLPAPGPAPAM